MNRSIVIFSGHVKDSLSNIDHKGAKSYSGVYEYLFNDAIVRRFEDASHRVSGIQYTIVQASSNIGLKERVEYTNKINPGIYLEIHHDSAQEKDIQNALREGESSPRWTAMSGFSVHYSQNNLFPETSVIFAQMVADEMLKDGFNPNLYHADGEKMRCVDRERGIYDRVNPTGLYVLYNIKSPAVVIECGTIINPHEEKVLLQENTQLKISNAIHRSIQKYFEYINSN